MCIRGRFGSSAINMTLFPQNITNDCFTFTSSNLETCWDHLVASEISKTFKITGTRSSRGGNSPQGVYDGTEQPQER